MQPKQLAQDRPAESAGGFAAAVAIIVCAVFGITDPAVYGALIIVVGGIPGLVTTIVAYRDRQRPQTEVIRPKNTSTK